MRKLFTIAFAIVLFRSLSIAQFEFSEDSGQQNIFTGKSARGMNIIIDSLMMDSIFTEYVVSNSIPGLATMAVKENQVIWTKNYGYRNLELQLPVNDSTTFRVASVSKTIVATAVMQLWEDELLDLEENINNYFPPGFTVTHPNFPTIPITAKMLLTHTSSISDNPLIYSLRICGDSPIELDTFIVNYFTPGGTYYSPSNFLYNIPPDSVYLYTNVGASLLAYIVEQISGKTFTDYCRDSIFVPLSMNSSSWFLEGMDTTNMAVPYVGSTPICHLGSPYYPAGFLRTNKLELVNFLSAYLNDGMFNNYRLLDSSTISYMLSDQLGYPLQGGIKIQGLIWFLVLPVDESVWCHDGSGPGVGTYVGINPLENYGMILLQNLTYSPESFFELINEFNQYAHSYEPIPVELNSFTATSNGKEITLNWSTATEVNNYGFEIQRSSNVTEFMTIGFVEGNGTTTQQHSYTYSDRNLDNGKNFYRLKQVDFNGSFEYSDAIEIEWKTFKSYLLEQNYPNPFNPTTKISWQSPVGSMQTLKVYDVLGREVATLINGYKPAGKYEINFDASNLPSGVYFYQIKSGSFVETKKMILLK